MYLQTLDGKSKSLFNDLKSVSDFLVCGGMDNFIAIDVE